MENKSNTKQFPYLSPESTQFQKIYQFHDIRNYITSIMGLSYLIENNLDQQKLIQEICNDIRSLIQKTKESLDEFITSTLNMSELFNQIQFQTWINETCETISHIFDIKIRTSFKGKFRIINFNPSKIFQVILNIIKNLVEAKENKNDICVDVDFKWHLPDLSSENPQERQFLSLKFSHCDLILTNTDFQNLLTPFQSSKENSLGIGFIACQAIIHKHGGYIAYDTREHKQGFRILLPVY